MFNVQSRREIIVDSLNRRYEDVKRAKELINDYYLKENIYGT